MTSGEAVRRARGGTDKAIDNGCRCRIWYFGQVSIPCGQQRLKMIPFCTWVAETVLLSLPLAPALPKSQVHRHRVRQLSPRRETALHPQRHKGLSRPGLCQAILLLSTTTTSKTSPLYLHSVMKAMLTTKTLENALQRLNRRLPHTT